MSSFVDAPFRTPIRLENKNLTIPEPSDAIGTMYCTKQHILDVLKQRRSLPLIKNKSHSGSHYTRNCVRFNDDFVDDSSDDSDVEPPTNEVSVAPEIDPELKKLTDISQLKMNAFEEMITTFKEVDSIVIKEDRDRQCRLRTLERRIDNTKAEYEKKKMEIFEEHQRKMVEKAKRNHELLLKFQKVIEDANNTEATRLAEKRAQILKLEQAKIEEHKRQQQIEAEKRRQEEEKRRAEEERVRREAEEKRLAEEAERKIREKPPPPVASSAVPANEPKPTSTGEATTSRNDYLLSLELEYLKVEKRVATRSESYKELIEKEKKLRSDIKKTVGFTINKVQRQSNNTEHAIALMKFFSKETVVVGMGPSTVNLNVHPQAMTFALDFTAQRFLDAIIKLSENALCEWIPHAMVISEIWSALPSFGKVFLDNVYSSCPFLLPIYFSQMTDEECQACIDKVVRRDSKDFYEYLQRTSAFARLIGVISTMKPRYEPIFSLDDIWTLLSATIKCKVRNTQMAEISATIVKSILESAGNSMYQSYGRMFKKLIHLLCREYFTQFDDSLKKLPAVVRLEQFLEDVIQNGGFVPPISTN